MGTFSSARRYVMHTFANTQSALMKKRVSQYMLGADCPVCRGKRLRREEAGNSRILCRRAQGCRAPVAGILHVAEPQRQIRALE